MKGTRGSSGTKEKAITASSPSHQTALPAIKHVEDLCDLTLSVLRALADSRGLTCAASMTRKEVFGVVAHSFGFGNAPSPPAAAASTSDLVARPAADIVATPASTLQATIDKLTEVMNARFDEVLGLKVQVSSLATENAALSTTVADLSEQVQRLQSAFDSVADAPERERKKCNLRITRLPAEVQSQETAEPFVEKLWDTLGFSPAPAAKFAKLTFASVTARPGRANHNGAITVTCATEGDKLKVLKSCRKLQNTDFHRVGVDEDLTKMQQETKSAAWDDYLQARREKKRASFRGGQLFVNGRPHCPVAPTSSTSSRQPATHTTPTLPTSNSFAPLTQI